MSVRALDTSGSPVSTGRSTGVLLSRASRVGWVLIDAGLRVAGAWLSTRPPGKRPLFTAGLVDIALHEIHQLGPTFIKMAQLLSTRVDVLPPELCDRLAELHDDVAPMDAATARRLVEERLGGRVDELFAEFDATAVAGGSIACVFRAVLYDGEVVAVKLRRPGVDDLLRADFTMMRGIARILAKVPAFASMPVREMVEQIGDAIAGQLDFTAEAASLGVLARNLGQMAGVRVPRVRADVTGPRHTDRGVLVMEFVADLVRRRPADLSAEARTLAVTRSLEAVYKMLFVDGVVHNDLHPGNLYFRTDGSIVVVDAGFVTTLSEKARIHFTEFFYAMSRGDEKTCADNLISTGIVGKPFDEVGFRREVGELVGSAAAARSGEFNLLTFAATLFDIQRRYALYADPEFVFPILSMLVLEGAIKEFDRSTDFQAKAAPYVLIGLSRKAAA